MPKEQTVLRKARVNLGYTQEEVATLLNVTQEYYSILENKKQVPNIDRMDDLASVLKLSREEVYNFFRKKK